MKRKTLWSVVLALVLVLILLPGQAEASELASGTCGRKLTWTLTEDGTLTISGTGAMEDYFYWDTASPWSAWAEQIKTLVVESGVTGIGESAFEDCTSLTTVTLSDTVSSLAPRAFSNCISLTEITIPKGVTAISDSAFYNCTGLTCVNLPEKLKTIDAYAFSRCAGLKEIQIPETVTEIGYYAFYRCTSLTELTLADSVEKMGKSAFEGCTSLTRVELPAQLAGIASRAFCDCTSLSSIYIHKNLTGISADAFKNCESLSNIYYEGTEAQWQAVSVASPAQIQTVNVHFNSQGIPAVQAAFEGASLSLNGMIHVNFYAALEGSAKTNAQVVFQINGKTQEVPVSQAEIVDGKHVFSCKVAASQMADEIQAQIYVDGAPAGQPATYSVQQYCANKLAESDLDKDLENLLIAMLNYGTAAQRYFQYNTDNLANSILTAEQKQMAAVEPSDLDVFSMNIEGTDAGIIKSGASLLLESETVIRYRIQLAEGYTIDQYTFRYGAEVLTPVQFSQDVYYVDVTGIAAKDLDQMYPITVGGLEIFYGPMSYVQRQLENENTAEVVTSLYHYNQMANAYFQS